MDARIAATADAAATARRLLGAQLKRCKQARDAVLLSIEPEALHAWRVALRRLMGLLRLCEQAGIPDTRQLRRQCQALAGGSSAARDLDTLLARFESPGAGVNANAKAVNDADVDARLTALTAGLRRRCIALHRHVNAALRGEDCLKFFEAASQLARHPARGQKSIGDAGQQLLRRGYRRLRRRARAAQRCPTVGRLHRLRLAAKQLRYAAEPLLPLYGRPLERYLNRLRALLDRLGTLNDVALAERQLHRLRAAARGSIAAVGLRLLARRLSAERSATGADLGRTLRRVRGRRWRQLRRAMRQQRRGVTTAQRS